MTRKERIRFFIELGAIISDLNYTNPKKVVSILAEKLNTLLKYRYACEITFFVLSILVRSRKFSIENFTNLLSKLHLKEQLFKTIFEI